MRFKAEIGEWVKASSYIEETLSNASISPAVLTAFLLSGEELFVNVASYAYKEKEGFCDLDLIIETDKVIMSISDNGQKFDPFEKKDPNINVPLEERNIGGLGIFMVKKLMDEVSYKYENNQNIVVVSKKL